MIIDNRANISEKSNKRHSQEKPVESTTRYKEYEEYTCLKKVIHQRHKKQMVASYVDQAQSFWKIVLERKIVSPILAGNP